MTNLYADNSEGVATLIEYVTGFPAHVRCFDGHRTRPWRIENKKDLARLKPVFDRLCKKNHLLKVTAAPKLSQRRRR